mgnify:CR=1 FL=1
MKLKKGSKEAKEYMASIRKMKGKSKSSAKKVGAIKIVEKGESKNAKPSAVYQYNRTKKGTFKGLKKIGATKSSTHKDTKSHNVNIRVVSGVIKLSPEEIKFLHSESKKSKGYTYRGKILFGQFVVLKETLKGTPVQKWIVDSMEKANYLSKELNKDHKIGNIKTIKLS